MARDRHLPAFCLALTLGLSSVSSFATPTPEQHAQEIAALIGAGNFEQAETTARAVLKDRPDDLFFLAQLDVALNGLWRFADADSVRERIRATWEQKYRAGWLRRGSPVADSAWIRVVTRTPTHQLTAAEYYQPQVTGTGALQLTALFKVLSERKARDRAPRLFKLALRTANRGPATLLEYIGNDTREIVAYGQATPDIRTVVADVVAFLDANPESAPPDPCREIADLLAVGWFAQAEAIVRQCVAATPEAIGTLGQLDIVLNGLGRHREADEVSERIIALWKQQRPSEQRAADPRQEMARSWTRMLHETRDYRLHAQQFYVPWSLRGSLTYFFRVVAIPRAKGRPQRIFDLEMSNLVGEYHVLREVLPNGGRQVVAYGATRPDLRRVVADTAAALNAETVSAETASAAR